jgi:hypothetical protein
VLERSPLPPFVFPIAFLKAGRQKSYAIAIFDLTYRWDDKKLSGPAFVHSIWNEQVYNQVSRSNFVPPNGPSADPDGLSLGIALPPRTFGGRTRYNF